MRRLLMLLVGLTLLTGCAHPRQSLSCDEISKLQAQIDKPFTRDELRAWIQVNYPDASANLVEDTVRDDPRVWFRWGNPDRTYWIMVWEEDTLMTMEWGGIEGTVGEAIACLGQPSHYAYYPTSGVSISFAHLDLLFATAGVYASGAKNLPLHPEHYPAVDAAFPISILSFSQPTSSWEAFLQVEFAEFTDKDLWIGRFKPWPVDWAEITISN